MTTAHVLTGARSPYVDNPHHRPVPGDCQTPHLAECYEREGGLFPQPLPFAIDTAPVVELREMANSPAAAAILFDAVHLPTVRRRAVQHAEAYRRAAESLLAGECATPHARWYVSQQAVAVRLAERILAEAKWTGSDSVLKPLFVPAGREISDAWSRLGAAYLWAAGHLTEAAALGTRDAAVELQVAAGRLECAVQHRRR